MPAFCAPELTRSVGNIRRTTIERVMDFNHSPTVDRLRKLASCEKGERQHIGQPRRGGAVSSGDLCLCPASFMPLSDEQHIMLDE